MPLPLRMKFLAFALNGLLAFSLLAVSGCVSNPEDLQAARDYYDRLERKNRDSD